MPGTRVCSAVYIRVWKAGLPRQVGGRRAALEHLRPASGHGLLPGGGCGAFTGPRGPRWDGLPHASSEFVPYSPAAWGGPCFPMFAGCKSPGQPAPGRRTRCCQGVAATGRRVCSWEPVNLLPSSPRPVLEATLLPLVCGTRVAGQPLLGGGSVAGSVRGGGLKWKQIPALARGSPNPADPPVPHSTPPPAFQGQADLWPESREPGAADTEARIGCGGVWSNSASSYTAGAPARGSALPAGGGGAHTRGCGSPLRACGSRAGAGRSWERLPRRKADRGLGRCLPSSPPLPPPGR